jgi:hypothetical protein
MVKEWTILLTDISLGSASCGSHIICEADALPRSTVPLNSSVHILRTLIDLKIIEV